MKLSPTFLQRGSIVSYGPLEESERMPFTVISLCILLLLGCNSNQDQQKANVDNPLASFPIIVQVEGMYCELCSKNIEQSFKEYSEVQSVKALISEEKVGIKIKENRNLSKSQITQVIVDAGYTTKKFLKYPGKLSNQQGNEHP